MDPIKKKDRKNANRTLKRVLSVLLAFIMMSGCAVFLAPSANAADFNIDTSNFKSNEKSAETIYYWHEGLPPADADGTKYPVLMTWDDKYYLTTDGTFVNTLNTRKETRLNKYDVAKKPETGVIKLENTIGSFSIADRNTKLTDKLISGSDFMNNCGAINGFSLPSDEEWALVRQERYGNSSVYIQGSSLLLSAREYNKHNLKDFIFTNKNDDYGQQIHRSYARTVTRFSMSADNTLTTHSVYQEYLSLKNSAGDFIDELLKNGFAATMSIPDLPYLVCAEPAPKTRVNSGLPSGMSTALTEPSQSRWAIWLPANGDTLTKENNWLVATQHYDTELVTWRDYTHAQGTSVRADFLYDFYLDIWSGNNNQGYDPKNFIDPGMRYQAKTFQGSADDAMDICMQKRTWVFDQVGDENKYYIYASCGLNMYVDPEMVPSDTGSTPFTKTGVYALTNLGRENTNILKLHGYGGLAYFDEYNTAQRITLLHDNNALVALGSDSYFWAHQDVNKSFFRIFWAEPITLNFYRKSFSIVDGQVINIDGPACIAENTVYRVKSGGVLALTDWIINNGVIIVEEGGTLLIQDNTDAYGHKRYGLLSSQVGSGDAGGRIACDGTIIIMPGCKIFGGGTYGIQLGYGASVVNYGVLASENFTCSSSYTIENRGDNSHVFAGSGVIGSGFSLTNFQITSNTYPCKGNVETNYKVEMAVNAVYGPCKANFYRSSKVAESDVSQTPNQETYSDVLTWEAMVYLFTADQLYEFDFPSYPVDDYIDGYTLYYNVWLYQGEKLEMWSMGDAVFRTVGYNYGVKYEALTRYPITDRVQVWRGRAIQWKGFGYPVGTMIFDGILKDWNPPAAHTIFYEQ